jgi:hypothetical protein
VSGLDDHRGEVLHQERWPARQVTGIRVAREHGDLVVRLEYADARGIWCETARLSAKAGT